MRPKSISETVVLEALSLHEAFDVQMSANVYMVTTHQRYWPGVYVQRIRPLLGLAHSMAIFADETRSALERNNVPGGKWDETTVTNLLVDRLRQIPGAAAAHAKDESKSGVDFEVWIQGRGHWFSFYAQAKKALSTSANAPATYDVGYLSGTPGTPQIELLRQTNAVGRPCLYALYNTPGLNLAGFSTDPAQDPSPSFYDSTTGYHRSLCPIDAHDEMDGITILPVEAMDKWLQRTRSNTTWKAAFQGTTTSKTWKAESNIHDTKALAFGVAQEAVPWSCLAACPEGGCDEQWVDWSIPDGLGLAVGNSPSTTDDNAVQIARSIYRLIASTAKIPPGWRGYPRPIPGLVADVNRGFFAEAPSYVPRPTTPESELGVVDVPSAGGSAEGRLRPRFVLAVWDERYRDAEPS